MNGRHRPVLTAVLAALCAVLIVTSLIIIVSTLGLTSAIRESQKANAGTLEATKRTLDRVVNCTTPGRKCFIQGQKRTAHVVSDINRVSILAAACADKPAQQSTDDIYACVVQKLAEKAAQ